ncbi:hypothetical protein [Zooshikella sp. RANM57]|uniref:hypothetical protein n=1 Tax=Zooshikella sp. RANM57 TaxID=3425863 RepID=UPI003D700967
MTYVIQPLAVMGIDRSTTSVHLKANGVFLFLQQHHPKQNAGKTTDEVVYAATAGSSVSGRDHGWPSDTGGVSNLICRVFPSYPS